jgi:7,8-dihydropterin-6-yl-methyl-4-(beta-D-ribofuranosyl)aminobenzene 5'-phosphate synthase
MTNRDSPPLVPADPEAPVLEPVDEVAVTILVDNSYDSLLADTGPALRAQHSRTTRVPAAQFAEGHTVPGLRAEHGFSALVTVRRGTESRSLLLDTGITPDGMTTNADRLGIDLTTIETVVLSHGHYDHTGGLLDLADRCGALPLVLHPLAWSPRRIVRPGTASRVLPTLCRARIEEAGYLVAEHRGPTTVLDGAVLVTGQIDRTSAFEQGMPFHEAFLEGRWVPDPSLTDDQAVVVHVRGRGLVVLTGCGHSGVVNTLVYARKLTRVDRVHALLGGLHLSGTVFEPIIEPTVAQLRLLSPDLIVPAHCTGWKAQHRLAETFAEAFVPNSVGTRYVLSAGTSTGAADDHD